MCIARDSWNETCFDLLKPFMAKQATNTSVFGENNFLNTCGLPIKYGNQVWFIKINNLNSYSKDTFFSGILLIAVAGLELQKKISLYVMLKDRLKSIFELKRHGLELLKAYCCY